MTAIYEEAEARAVEMREQVLEGVIPYQREEIELPDLAELFKKLTLEPDNLWHVIIAQFDQTTHGQIGQGISDEQTLQILESLHGFQAFNPVQARMMGVLKPINSFVIEYILLTSHNDSDRISERMNVLMENYETICTAIVCFATKDPTEHSPLAVHMGHFYPNIASNRGLTEPTRKTGAVEPTIKLAHGEQ